MKITVKAGAKAWFNEKYRGADVAEFMYDTTLEVKPISGNDSWLASVGHVPGFPLGHPTILIWKGEVTIHDDSDIDQT